MRSHAKASTAGSTQRQASGLGRIFRGAFATRGALLTAKGSGARKAGRSAIAVVSALLAAMALSASPASASKAHNFKENLGSAEQPEINEGKGLAIDQSTGDVLLMDAAGSRIKRFKPDGTPDDFSALGTNIIDGTEGPDATPQNGLSFASASESQIAVDNSGTATDGNIYVTHGSPNAIDIFAKTGAYLGQLSAAGTTDFSEACGVAVDPSGAVYVGDYSSGIYKFVPSGSFPVNTDNTANFTTTTNPCTLAAGAGPTAGFLFPAQYSGEVSKIDGSTGELKYSVASGSHTTVSVDPGTGHVFAAADSTLEELDASGAVSATELSATKSTESIRGIGVRASSGEIYLSLQIRVAIYDAPIVTLPDATTTTATTTGVRATLNGTVNPDGVELSECKFEYGQTLAYGQSVPCAESPATIGMGTSPVAVHADVTNLQPNGVNYHFRLIAKNPQGASVTTDESFFTADTVITTAASGLSTSAATLTGTVNPDSVAMTECLFEWGPTTSYGNAAPCVPNAAGIGSGTSPVPVSANIGGLHTGTVYHYRLKAANANGPILAKDETLQTVGPRIVDTWAEDVGITEAVLKSEINPEGQATTYRFEYGTSEAYGSETAELNVGSDSSVHEVRASLADLQPGTTYHYRAVATSAAGENEGPDRTIRTFARATTETDCPNRAFRYGAGANLPDCRAYEMVSPLDKNNGDIKVKSTLSSELGVHLQSSSSGNRLAYGSFRAFGDAESAPWNTQYIAARGEEGWSSHGVSPPRTHLVVVAAAAFNAEFKVFSPDLCQAWMVNFAEPTLAEGAVPGFKNLYRRQDEECGGREYEALTTTEPVVPPGNEFSIEVQGVSADLGHVVFAANAELTPDVQPGPGAARAYEYVGGQLRYVCVLPNGEPVTSQCTAGGPGNLVFGNSGGGKDLRVDNAISADASRIFWTAGNEGPIYVRIDGTETVAVSKTAEEEAGTSSSVYWAASDDGSKAIFTTGGRLYEFDVDSETTHLIAGGMPTSFNRPGGVAGASEDASRIYFVSTEALDAGAEEGAVNLYFYEAGDGGGEYRFIAQLASGREDEAVAVITGNERTSRVTPDGLRAAFVSYAPLTGYDNTDVRNGKAVSEVYRYDATANGGAGELTCISCNPSGQRPLGPSDEFLAPSNESSVGLPAPVSNLQAPHVLSDDGFRLFFESNDALSLRDSNGRRDVYQWEAPGAGSCDEADSSFAPSAGGCISPISTGQSTVDTGGGLFAGIVDATADGDDVFFYTTSSLVSQDYGLQDIYDARVGGGYPVPPEAPECVGDACQSIPAAPNDPTPASAGFRGAGDPQPRKAKRRCRARKRHGAKGSKARHKKGKRCRHNNRRAGR